MTAKMYLKFAPYALFLLLCAFILVNYVVIQNCFSYKCINESLYAKVRKNRLAMPLKRIEEHADFDLLMRRILTPKVHCKASVVLGGSMWPDHRVDGDKVVCLDPGRGLPKNCTVYSFGVAGDWSFDEAIQTNFGCQVYAFDPSIGKEDHKHRENIWFYNLALGYFDGEKTVYGKIWKTKTLDSILKQLNHQNRTIDMLKMDIEGDEFTALEDIVSKNLMNRVNNLCVEIHLNYFPHWDRVLRLLQKIEESGLVLFSTRNNTIIPPTAVPGIPARQEYLLFEMAWFRK